MLFWDSRFTIVLSITCKVLSVKGTQLVHVHFQPHPGGKGGGGGGASHVKYFLDHLGVLLLYAHH